MVPFDSAGPAEQPNRHMTTTKPTASDLINSLPYRILIKDRECRYLLCNAAQLQALGAANMATLAGEN